MTAAGMQGTVLLNLIVDILRMKKRIRVKYRVRFFQVANN